MDNKLNPDGTEVPLVTEIRIIPGSMGIQDYRAFGLLWMPSPLIIRDIFKAGTGHLLHEGNLDNEENLLSLDV